MSTTPAPEGTPSTAPVFDRASTAHVSTDRPGRYGKQLASHMGRKITTSWDEASGTGSLVFDRDGQVRGSVDLTAQEGELVLALRSSVNDLANLEQVTGIHLARFGVSDGLAVAWTRDDGSQGTSQGPLTQEDLAAHKAEREARRARDAQA